MSGAAPTVRWRIIQASTPGDVTFRVRVGPGGLQPVIEGEDATESWLSVGRDLSKDSGDDNDQ